MLLAHHLTWLRIQGEIQDPRLLATVADRAPASNFSRTRLRPISTVGTECSGEGGVDGEEHGDNAPRVAEAGVPSVPLEPFLQLTKRGKSDKTTDGLGCWRGINTQAAEAKREGPQLTPNVHTLLKEHRPGSGRSPRSERGDQEERRGRATSMERVPEAAGRCGFLHLVVDGVVFQVQAARPSGMMRVWGNVLPAVRERGQYWTRAFRALLIHRSG